CRHQLLRIPPGYRDLTLPMSGVSCARRRRHFKVSASEVRSEYWVVALALRLINGAGGRHRSGNASERGVTASMLMPIWYPGRFWASHRDKQKSGTARNATDLDHAVQLPTGEHEG